MSDQPLTSVTLPPLSTTVNAHIINNNNNNNPPPQQPQPQPHSNKTSPVLIRVIFLLLGVGVLIPWNAFVSAKPYFQARLCQVNKDNKDNPNDNPSTVLVNVELWFGFIWNISSVLSLGLIIVSVAIRDACRRRQPHMTLLLPTTTATTLTTTAEASTTIIITNNNNNNNTIVDQPIPPSTFTRSNSSASGGGGGGDSHTSTSSHHSHHHSSTSTSGGHSFWLVMLPLALYLLVFLFTDLLVLIPSIEPELFLKLTLTSLALCGTCGAVATAGILSTAGLFESHVGITPFFSGQALGGVAVSLANFMAAALDDREEEFWHTTTCRPMMTTTMTTALPPNNHLLTNDSQVPNTLTISSVMGRSLATTASPPSSSCSSYETLDWAVFGFFLAGCVVLAGCLVGYAFVIARYQQEEHRDNYQAVQDVLVEEGVLEHPSSNNVPDAPTSLRQETPSTNTTMGQLEMKNQNAAATATATAAVVVAAPSTSAPNQGRTVDTSTTISYHDDATSPSSPPPLLLLVAANGGGGHGTRRIVADDFVDEEDETTVEPEEYTDEENEWAVFSAIKGPWTTIFLVFALTLCLFPSWVSQLRSIHQCQNNHHNRMVNDLYTPLTFVVFNVGDLCGRLLSEHVPVTHIRNLSSKLVAAALGRLVVFPILFLMCVTEQTRRHHWVPLIPHDAYSWTVQFFFALTNGLLVSLSFMHAPQLVAHNTTMQERASEMMTFSVSFGLLTGSLLSFPFATVASWL